MLLPTNRLRKPNRGQCARSSSLPLHKLIQNSGPPQQPLAFFKGGRSVRLAFEVVADFHEHRAYRRPLKLKVKLGINPWQGSRRDEQCSAGFIWQGPNVVLLSTSAPLSRARFPFFPFRFQRHATFRRGKSRKPSQLTDREPSLSWHISFPPACYSLRSRIASAISRKAIAISAVAPARRFTPITMACCSVSSTLPVRYHSTPPVLSSAKVTSLSGSLTAISPHGL